MILVWMILVLMFGLLFFLGYLFLKTMRWRSYQKTLFTFCRWAGPDLLADRQKQAELFWLMRRLGIFPAECLGESNTQHEANFQRFIHEVLHGKLTMVASITEPEDADKVRANP